MAELNWKHSGLEEAARVRVALWGGTVDQSVDWIRSLAYHMPEHPSYCESGGICVTSYLDDLGELHAKVTISVYGVAKHLGVWDA